MNKKQKNSLILIITSVVIFIICKFLPFDGFGDYSHYIEIGCYFLAYIMCGAKVLKKAVFNIFSGRVFDENFLMAVATIGAFCLGEAEEAAMVVMLYRVGVLFESFAAERSRRSIKELMDIMPDFAAVERNGQVIMVEPDEVEPGEVIVVKAGGKIPLDGKVISGSSTLDTSALTGESTPLNVTEGDKVISGSINCSGVIRVVTESSYENSTVGKIAELIETSSAKKAKTENFITRFAAVYTPIVVVAAVLMAVVLPIAGWATLKDSIYRALNFLVVSCPCALVISVPLSFFGGMGASSRRGILVKGATYLENFSKIKCCIFDKTGTLTSGSFKVTAIHPEKVTEAELLRVAAAVESFSDHPLSLSLVSAYGKVPDIKVSNVTEIAGEGIKAQVLGKSVLVGNQRLMEKENIEITECKECINHSHGGSTVHIAVDKEYMGHIVMSDQIKEGAADAIRELKAAGIRTVMMSGDRAEVAQAVADELGIDEVYAGLLPDGKVQLLEDIMSKSDKNEKIAFVGDGINDAPVLTRADVGISMGAMGSDAAIEAADIVIMDDSVKKLAVMRKIASRTMLIVNENIIFAIGLKLLVLILSAFGYAPMWLAIFADVGVTIIATLNAARAMLLK